MIRAGWVVAILCGCYSPSFEVFDAGGSEVDASGGAIRRSRATA
jgi:hypothetical protein